MNPECIIILIKLLITVLLFLIKLFTDIIFIMFYGLIIVGRERIFTWNDCLIILVSIGRHCYFLLENGIEILESWYFEK